MTELGTAAGSKYHTASRRSDSLRAPALAAIWIATTQQSATTTASALRALAPEHQCLQMTHPSACFLSMYCLRSVSRSTEISCVATSILRVPSRSAGAWLVRSDHALCHVICDHHVIGVCMAWRRDVCLPCGACMAEYCIDAVTLLVHHSAGCPLLGSSAPAFSWVTLGERCHRTTDLKCQSGDFCIFSVACCSGTYWADEWCV